MHQKFYDFGRKWSLRFSPYYYSMPKVRFLGKRLPRKCIRKHLKMYLGLQIPYCEDDNGNDVDLFELKCTPSSATSTHQMSITIKESCRKKKFRGIDFAHSFIWGDQVSKLLLAIARWLSQNWTVCVCQCRDSCDYKWALDNQHDEWSNH